MFKRVPLNMGINCKEYIYKFTHRGLFSELNSFLGFYETIDSKSYRVYLDSASSRYFASISIYDIFNFPDTFKKNPITGGETLLPNQFKRAARPGYQPSVVNHLTYTQAFEGLVSSRIQKLKLPKIFNCIHIRRGDKIGEAPYLISGLTGGAESKRYEAEDYIQKCNLSIKSIFIMTDDYQSINEVKQYLQQNNLDHKLYYITTEQQTGHCSITENNTGKAYTIQELVDLFTEIEIAKKSQQFIGTENSNIYCYIKNQCVNNTEFINLD